MRILVEPSDYILRNAGDMAMMQVGVERLSALWPQAQIQIISDVPEQLPAYAPNTQPLDTAGRQIWYRPGFLAGRLEARLPPMWRKRIRRYEWPLRRRQPEFVAAMLRRKLRWAGYGAQALDEFLVAVTSADLVIATGMGGITDAFPDYALELLTTLALAQRQGVATVMVGQGMGPLRDRDLRTLAQQVLPKVDFISLREQRAGGPLLQSLGVPMERVLTTGDDAVEMAYMQRPATPGDGLGVNLRMSDYAAVDEQLVARLRPLVQTAAQALAAPLIPVPISTVPGEADAITIRQLLLGYPLQPVDATEEVATPLDVIRRIQRCRVVVSGSYHAAVFALSMGIPAIGLARSAYYEDKFLGLADQFGPGCQVVLLDDPNLSARLTGAIATAWRSVAEIQPQLLAAAAHQVALSHTAYQRIFELVEARAKQRPSALRPRVEPAAVKP